MNRRFFVIVSWIFFVIFLSACNTQFEQTKPLPAVSALPEPPASTDGEQILFGDLHVHTTLSVDALAWNLPANLDGKGLRPISEACDFARFCSAIDFFASTDHAESMTPASWQMVREDVRQCNDVSGDPKNPDLVAFTGFEWTQLADSYQDYYGHKNVIFKDTADDRLPARPIASKPFPLPMKRIRTLRYGAGLLDLSNVGAYVRLADLLEALGKMAHCPEGVPVRELPPDCMELAPRVSILFDKLDDWGFDTLVIPHGTTWGMHVPFLVDWSTQIDENNPKYQRLIEIYSGHGNIEEYREWRAAAWDENGNLVCPEPTPDYLPCCWRAGEIARERCRGTPEECEAAVADAKRKYLEAGLEGHLTIKVDPFEWQDCGQCRDCFKPAFSHRPGASAQRALTVTGKDGGQYKFGFIASSDTHKAKAGNGYAPLRAQSDFMAGRNWFYSALQARLAKKAIPWEFERQESYWYTGGLVAVHAEGRDRDSIWQALVNKRTYGTSGTRILLWFDLVNHLGEEAMPMGSDLVQEEPPRFRVKAVGSPVMNPGCPQVLVEALGKEFIDDVCNGQCYNPSHRRYPIKRIEVVKIRQQLSPAEPVEPLIQDPFLVIQCGEGKTVCEAEFQDPDYAGEDRTVSYYVRAVQWETSSVNAQNLKCRYEDDTCVEMDPCLASGAPDNTCMGVAEGHAWSSPIYLTPPRS